MLDIKLKFEYIMFSVLINISHIPFFVAFKIALN